MAMTRRAAGPPSKRAMWWPTAQAGARVSCSCRPCSIGLAPAIRSGIQKFWSTQVHELDVNLTSSRVPRPADRADRADRRHRRPRGPRRGRVDHPLRRSGSGCARSPTTSSSPRRRGSTPPGDPLHLDLLRGAGRPRRGPRGRGTNLQPGFGFDLLLPIFAAVILGGIGDPFGALTGGLVLGVVIEWSTLFVEPRWKVSFGFIALIIALIIRPQGIFGRARAV